MSEPRDALLHRIIEHVAANGMSDMSLRELADAVGTSHRMLIYHFGGRPGIVAAIVAATEAQQRALLSELSAAGTSTDPAAIMRAQWAVLSDPAMWPFVRLFFEVLAHALLAKPGTEGFLEGLTAPWIEAATQAGETIGSAVGEADARLGIAVLRGLLLDAVASGDAAPATAALERFITMWQHRPV